MLFYNIYFFIIVFFQFLVFIVIFYIINFNSLAFCILNLRLCLPLSCYLQIPRLLGCRYLQIQLQHKTFVYHTTPESFIIQFVESYFSANTIHWANAALTLTHRLRHWPNVKAAPGACLVFSDLLATRYLHYPQTHENWLKLKSILNQCLNKFIATKMTSPRDNLPWLSKSLLASIRKKSIFI